MATSQWVGLAFFLLLIAGLLYAFVRSGSKVKSDKSHDAGSGSDWSDHSGHGADSSGH